MTLTVFQNNANKTFMLTAVLASMLALPAYASVPIEQRSLSGNNNTGANAAGATTTPAENTQGSTLWQLYQQVQQLQQEVRDLRGQLEDQQNSLNTTQKDFKNRYADLDQRIELINQAQNPDDSNNPNAASTESSTADGKTDTAAATTTASSDTASSTNISNTSKANTVAAVPAVAVAPETAKTASKAPAKTAGSSTTTAGTDIQNGITAPANTGDAEKDAYVGAYDAYKNGGAAKAIRPMQDFIKTYPNSVYVPNAHYWLGEFYLASDPVDFVKAKQSFLIVVSKYPKSAKASTSLYRLATITKEIDHRPQEAVTMMRKVIQDYPSSQEANFARSFINSN